MSPRSRIIWKLLFPNNWTRQGFLYIHRVTTLNSGRTDRDKIWYTSLVATASESARLVTSRLRRAHHFRQASTHDRPI
jgi:hypothetical protein